MKTKASQVPTPRARGTWRIVAVISIAGNVALAIWLARSQSQVAATPAPAVSATPVPTPKTAIDPAMRPYAALGSYMAENNRIADLHWSEPQFAAFIQGVRANYDGRGLPLDEDARKLRDQISESVQKMLAVEQPDPVQEYFSTLRQKEGVLRTGSDLHYRITEPGTGAQPKADDVVVLSFAARLPDGQELPALSRTRVKMAVRDLLPGLAEGVQLLHESGKGLIYLPPKLAFAEDHWPAQIPHGVPIGFFVELHSIETPSRQ